MLSGSHGVYKSIGQYDSVNTGIYTLYLNQWGKNGATSGQSCAAVTSTSGNNVAWTTSWTWSGGDGVKSYTNINANNGLNVKLSAINSIKVGYHPGTNRYKMLMCLRFSRVHGRGAKLPAEPLRLMLLTICLPPRRLLARMNTRS